MDETQEIKTTSFWDFKGAEDYIDEWFLMGSPFPMLLILITYLFFVLRCGPKFMENRPPYKLRRVIIAYNAFQVAFSIYLVYIGLSGMFEFGLAESGCYRIKYKKEFVRLCRGHYFYFLAKMTELLDTVFFVLRKKWNQVSFLHVYHHSLMYSAAWFALKYEPTYSIIFLGTLNSFVHVIMYSYYGLSAFPSLKKYLWWKKYITKMQLIQFLLVIINVTWNWNVSTCPVSYIMISTTWGNLILFMYLFTVFYIKSYIQKRKGAAENAARRSQKESDNARNNISGLNRTKAEHVD